MIELSRTLVRQFRAVVRKSVLAADPHGPCPLVVCRAGRQGFSLFCRQGPIGVRHHVPGSFRPASVASPYSKLADLEGADEVIALEQTAPFKGRASWQAGGEPHTLDFDTADPASLPPAPEPARNAASLEPGFLSALDDAARTASREAIRYATNRILLRGRDGAVIATDGRQLLLQGGFPFPWRDDQFFPALPVFGGKELPRDQPVRLGLAKERITLEVGPWLFDVKAEQGARYPDVDRVIPDAGAAFTRLRLDARDIEMLIQRLPRLPAHDDPHRPVTLDLGNAVALRSRSEQGETSEVLLPHAKREGPSLQLVVDRRYLLRALKLGFTDVLVVSAQQPLLCRDASRTYVWMPLSEADAVPHAQADPIRPKRRATAAPPETPRSAPMPPNEPRVNGRQRNGSADQDEPLDPVAEAEELRGHLQAALARTGRLLAALKHQKRQSRVVESALASLRRLQQP
ncbi:MAG: hypothetical protein U0736_20630 [Gemmataceae bacterium]